MKSKPNKAAHTSEPRRILVPVDFSDASNDALQCAVRLAERLGGTISLLHVVESYPIDHLMGLKNAMQDNAWLFDQARVRLEQSCKQFVPKRSVRVERLVNFGKPFHKICEAAQEKDTDLIVLGTHGYTGLKHIQLGSVAERVVRHAPCPVLVVRGRAKRDAKTVFSPDKMRSILVPMDFSEPSFAALPHALVLAQRYDAQLTLLHVIEPLHPDMLIDTTETQRTARAAAHQRLTKLWEATKKVWPRTGHELRSGHPVDTVTALAKRTNADLIVLGTHGRTGLKRALIGSVAERVVRLAPCPVLVVR